MKKVLKNLAIMIALGLGYLFAGNRVSSTSIMVVVGLSVVLELMGQFLGCFNELDLQSKENLSDEQIENVRNMRLVVKDTALVYVISYLLLTSPFGIVSYSASIPYLVASLTPAVSAFVISRAARMSAQGKSNAQDNEDIKNIA